MTVIWSIATGQRGTSGNHHWPWSLKTALLPSIPATMTTSLGPSASPYGMDNTNDQSSSPKITPLLVLH